MESYTHNDDVCRTSFADETLRDLFEWNDYVDSVEDIGTDDLNELIENCISWSGLEKSNVAVESVRLCLSNDIYDDVRNELYIYFSQSQEFEDGSIVTYYYPFYASNIKVTTDDNGNTKLNVDSVEFVQEDYLTELPANNGWVPLNWTENTTE